MAGVFLDTNVLLYAARTKLVGADALKRPIALGLISDGDFKTSGQILAEFYHNAVKDGPYKMPAEKAIEWIGRVTTQPCVAIDVKVVKSAIDISQRYKISYWDGAIIAAAQEADADLLYTEDLNDGQHYGSVTAINPFKSISH